MKKKVLKAYRDIRPDTDGAILLTDEADIYYMTGFHTTARRPKQIGANAAVVLPSEQYFVIPAKWVSQIEGTIDDRWRLVLYDGSEADYFEKLAGLLSEDTPVIWTEYGTLPFRLWMFLKERFPGRKWMDITRRVEESRSVKSEYEIVRLRKAAGAAVAAMEHLQSFLKAGMREWDIVAEAEYQMRKSESEGVPFTMKALSGPGSAVVTEVPGMRKLQNGDLVLLDFGAVCDGYASDWTRTFCIGDADSRQKEIYEGVLQIKRICESLLRPGIPLAELVRIAQSTAQERGFQDFCPTHLGHSVGIRSHEWPILDVGAQGTLKAQMVITIEPGIYVPGVGGVRLEDEYLITKDGAERLTGLRSEHWIL